MEAFFKFISKPINISLLLSIFITSLLLVLLNFLPSNIKADLHLSSVLENYSGYIFAIVVLSFFLIIFQGIPKMVQFYKKKKAFKKIHEARVKILDNPDAWEILQTLYQNGSEPVELPLYNKAVNQLTTLKMIVRLNRHTNLIDFENPYFKYVLQNYGEDLVEKRIKKEI